MNQRASSIIGVLIRLVESRISFLEGHDIVNKVTSSQDADELHSLHTHEDPAVRKAVAENPHTSGKTLDNLKDDKDPSIKSAVASNPNIMPHTMEHLFISGHDHEILANPALPLNQLDNPSFLANLHKKEMNDMRGVDIAKDTKDPVQLHYLSKSKKPAIRMAAAESKYIHPHTLDALSNDEDEYVRKKVANNDKAKPETLEKLHTDKGKNGQIQAGVAENPSTPPHILHKMALGDTSHHFSIAGNDSANPETLRHIHQKDTDTGNLLFNKNTPGDVLKDIHAHAKNMYKKSPDDSPEQEWYMQRMDIAKQHPNWSNE